MTPAANEPCCAACDYHRTGIDRSGTQRNRACMRISAAGVDVHFALGPDADSGCPAFEPAGTAAIEPAVMRHLERMGCARGWSPGDFADALRVARLYPNAADWRPEGTEA